MRVRVWFGLAGVLGLSPEPAYAAEGAAAAMLPYILGAILVVVAAASALVAARERRRAQRLSAERSEALTALAGSRAALDAAPAVLFRWDWRDGSETFTAGASAALGGVASLRVADLLARVAT